MADAVEAVVDFPLRGEWRAVNTPAHTVPSHGTDFFAQRYAFDFARMDASGTWFYPGGARALLRHLSIGLPAGRFFAWNARVYSVFAGRVVAARDGWDDRARVILPWELLRSSFATPRPMRDGDYRPLAGNFIIMEGDAGFALYAHLRRGSIRVQRGEQVAAGDVIAHLGNSGNSTMPHLHFHLMDRPDPLRAAAVACAFRNYERWSAGAWHPVSRGVPDQLERIRCGNMDASPDALEST